MPAELTPDNPEQITIDSFEPIRLELLFDRHTSRYAILVKVRNTQGKIIEHAYRDEEAKTILKNLNSSDFSTTHLRERILLKLENDGILPPGTVSDDELDLV